MKIIISLNGIDGSGKSTQAELLKNKNPNLIDVFGSLENYIPFNQDKRDFDWWFLNSSPQEFLHIIYKSISERNEKIKLSNKPIIIIDKGIINFDIRVISTLLTKSLNEEKSKELIQSKKEELNIKDIEDFKIFFINSSPNQKNQNLKFHEIYENYQIYQKKLLEKYLSNTYKNDIIFNSKGYIDEVSNNLNNLIFNLLKTKIALPVNKTIFGIGGLSESGKSSVGLYLSNMFNIWNLKLTYFIEEICNRYQIKIDELNLNDKRYVSILEAEEISHFLNIHYYQKIISIESLYSYLNSVYFKDIFQDSYQIIFIDTSIEKRIDRNAISLGKDKLTSKTMINDKDHIKISRGAEEIRNIADFIINNDTSKIHLYEQIDHIVNKINMKKDKIITKEINQFNIPINYKNILETIYKKILLNTNLKLFILHGSCSNETVIEKFSDIDLIMVIEPNDKNTRKIINEIISQNNGIKIGTTIYNKKELENLFVDFKTLLALYRINIHENFPIFVSDIIIPTINKNLIIQNCKKLIPGEIHELRRILYDNETNLYDKIFKELAHIMKHFLILEEIYSKSYFEAYKYFSEIYKIKEFDVNKYFKNEQYKKEIEDYANYVLDNLNIVIESKNEKRKACRGIILKDDNIILIHRIKQNKEYYVFPGGGVEKEESNEQCILREIKEELGINVKIVKYLYRLETIKDIEYYFLCEYLNGEIGTGTGPEFTDKDYLIRGKYISELHPLNSIEQLELKNIVSSSIIQDIEKYNSLKNAPFKNLI